MACWERTLRMSVLSWTRPICEVVEGVAEQEQLGLGVERRAPDGGAVGGPADLQPGVVRGDLEVRRRPDDRAGRQVAHRLGEAQGPGEAPHRRRRLEDRPPAGRRVGAPGDVRPDAVVVQGLEQRLGVVRGRRPQLDGPAAQDRVHRRRPGGRRPRRVVRDAGRSGRRSAAARPGRRRRRRRRGPRLDRQVVRHDHPVTARAVVVDVRLGDREAQRLVEALRAPR